MFYIGTEFSEGRKLLDFTSSAHNLDREYQRSLHEHHSPLPSKLHSPFLSICFFTYKRESTVACNSVQKRASLAATTVQEEIKQIDMSQRGHQNCVQNCKLQRNTIDNDVMFLKMICR
jgi:hypothetical protein